MVGRMKRFREVQIGRRKRMGGRKWKEEDIGIRKILEEGRDWKVF